MTSVTDLLKELRAGQWRRDQVRSLCERAADEIERLHRAAALIADQEAEPMSDQELMERNIANLRGITKWPLALRVSVEHYLWLADRASALPEANEVIRSAYAIADRSGIETNWPAFKERAKRVLDQQHAIMHLCSTVADENSTCKDD